MPFAYLCVSSFLRRGARFIEKQLKENLDAMKKRDTQEMAKIKHRFADTVLLRFQTTVRLCSVIFEGFIGKFHFCSFSVMKLKNKREWQHRDQEPQSHYEGECLRD